eukprot:TRINITY_DN510_c0_g1_i1.p2 TRINITY_DN510_c0_g1~~TRINITY_DN510_c0_g1_i1.p2  ORF type:complete len:331 (-),score=26.66 TRINITY_DN510_c0_g1_i1:1562-2554(-)
MSRVASLGSTADKEEEIEDSNVSLAAQSLNLQELDSRLYLAPTAQLWRPIGARGVFGGQILGQALVAASREMPPEFKCHSLHAYFLLAGNAEQNIVYYVEVLARGKTYARCNVVASQRNKRIFGMLVSFVRDGATGPTHCKPMPQVPPPEELSTIEELTRKLIESPTASQRVKEGIRQQHGNATLDVWPVDPVQYWHHFAQFSKPAVHEAGETRCMWVRTKEKLDDDENLHRCVAAFASDRFLLGSARVGHNLGRNSPIQMMSLDHTMWFHRPFKADEPMLYVCHSPIARDGRAMTLADIYTKEGELAITVAQEGVFRDWKASSALKAKL